MRPNFIILGALVILPAWMVFAAAPSRSSTAGVQEIRMTARKYQFNPNIITVRKGEHVKLMITALDRDHGFALPAFGINQKLKKGIPTSVEFTSNKTGTFQFRCSVFCGLGHRHMKGTLIVKGN